MSTNSAPESSRHSESDEESQIVVKSSTKKIKRCFTESEDNTSGETTTHCTTPRSSERLRKKSQRVYSMPDRKKTLDKIVVRDTKYEDWSLKPRRLTSDFVRGLSRYVTDRTEVFESDDSELSDFIDDSRVLSHKSQRPRKKTQKSKISVKTKEKDETAVRKRRRQKISKQTKQLSSNDELQSEEDIESEITCRKSSKQKKYLSSDDGTESKQDNSSSDNDIDFKKSQREKNIEIDSSDSDGLLNRKLPKRTNSAKKEMEKEMLAKLMAKRKMEKVKLQLHENGNTAALETIVSESDTNKELLNRLDSDTEGTQEENDLGDDLEEGDSDREFVDDGDADPDEVTQFVDYLHNADNEVDNGRLKSKERRLRRVNSFQRIVNPVESDESDNEASFSLDSVTADVFKAIKKNDVESVRSVLETNHNIVHELGPNRRSLLHYAVISGSYEITKLLVNSNADKAAVDSYFLQPIGYALLTGQVNCFKLLLQNTDLHKLNKMYKENFKSNFLHFVVCGKTSFPDFNCAVVESSGLFQLLSLLFEHDKNLFLKLTSEKDSRGFTPLVAAVIAGHCECVEYLLHNGALLDDFESENGGNLLHLAVECSMEEKERSSCLKVLLSSSLKHKVEEVDHLGFTPLMYASESGNHDCVLALLEAGASVLCRDTHGTSSLHLAAASGDTQSVKHLLKYGHQVDCLDKCGWPPLLYANFAAQESCVLSLMEPNPKQIFVLGDLLRRGTSEAGKELNFKVVKDVLIALANQDAYYRVFNDFIRHNPGFLDEYDSGLLHKTWRALLDYDNKQTWFKRKLADLREGWIRNIQLNVDRQAVFESAMKVLNKFSGSSLRTCRLEVTFKNEVGICTGPKREFFVNICKDIVDSRHELFHLTDDNQYSFVPNAYFATLAKIEGGTIEDATSKLANAQHCGRAHVDSNGSSSTNVDNIEQSCITADPSGSSSTNVDNNEQSCLTVDPSGSPSRNLDTTQNSTQVPNSAVEFMDEEGDIIIAELDTSTVDHVVSSSTNVDTTQNSTQVPNSSVEYMDEEGDIIIAELDTSTVDPGVSTSTNMDTVQDSIHNHSVEYMDEEGDTIISELDTSNINSYFEEQKADSCDVKNASTSKLEFSRHVDRKLTKNIAQLKFLGRIIGTAICEGHFLNLHLCKPLVKQILGIKLKHPDDLSSFDYELHKNLVTFVLESDDVEEMMLPCDLNVVNPWNGSLTTIQLFPDETNKEFLNDKNKVEYVDLVSEHKLTVLIRKEMDSLCRGLYEVIPKSLFSLFTADEFSLLINGIGKIDVEDWQKNTVYTPRDAESKHVEIKWFWEIVSNLKQEEKALLLKFSSGSPCLPAGGFSQLQGLGGARLFHITMKSDRNKIPTASTCFNSLKLPLYDNKKDLNDKLLIAIRHGTEGFSFS